MLRPLRRPYFEVDRQPPLLLDLAQVAKSVADRVVGVGPLQPFLDDPEVEEIWINEPGKVFVAKAGQPRLTTTVLDEQQVHDLVELMVARRRPGRPGRPPPRWGTEGAWVLPCGRPSLVDGLTQPYRTTQSRRKPAAGRHRRTPPRCSAGRPMGG